MTGDELCDDCGERIARIAVSAIESEPRLDLDPPTHLCVGCYAELWRQARAEGHTLERAAVGPADEATRQLLEVA